MAETGETGLDPTSEEVMEAAGALVEALPALAIALARSEVGNAVAAVAAEYGIHPKDRMITNVRLLKEKGYIDPGFKSQLEEVRILGNKAFYAPGAPLLTAADAKKYLYLSERVLRSLKEL